MSAVGATFVVSKRAVECFPVDAAEFSAVCDSVNESKFATQRNSFHAAIVPAIDAAECESQHAAKCPALHASLRQAVNTAVVTTNSNSVKAAVDTTVIGSVAPAYHTAHVATHRPTFASAEQATELSSFAATVFAADDGSKLHAIGLAFVAPQHAAEFATELFSVGAAKFTALCGP